MSNCRTAKMAVANYEGFVMLYLSCDLETTGLEPLTCQIIEIGIHLCDLSSSQPIASFHRYVKWPLCGGDIYALVLNSAILKKLNDDPVISFNESIDGDIISGFDLCQAIYLWLQVNNIIKICCAGKNFGIFDYQFLRQLPNFNLIDKILGHRHLDVGTLFVGADDIGIPDLNTCLIRAGISEQTDHTALNDALLVHKLLHCAYLRSDLVKKI